MKQRIVVIKSWIKMINDNIMNQIRMIILKKYEKS